VITLEAPSVYLAKQSRYVIAGLTLKLDAANGRTCDMRLVPPEVYSVKLTKKKAAKVELW